MRSSNIITITGAGSARTPALVGSLVKLKDRFPLKKIIFYDIDNERTSKMEDYIRLVLKAYCSETEVIFTTDPDVAYEKQILYFVKCVLGKTK
ncbi:glycoside hydrolase [Clostridium sartagoforme AAU1]|uniref:Glycoside hydrolase n=1 Tax=Clostridium sartagoforme AAU1 TaxID=1202534 RepID=R9C6J2_9CLOT|nr:glycoside hydrolase [Clostridium sartagoforme]EOR24927.1 glycoside hydrolase [Clostridium sartagoforme AAU1]